MSMPFSPPLTSEAELHYTRGLLHLRRGEAVMPYAMAVREEKAPPGTDVLLALLGLATVATSRVLGQTRWIEQYRAEMRTALSHFEKAVVLAPDYADIYFRRASAFRHLGESDMARISAREAVRLAPENRDYAAFLRVLEGANSAPPMANPSFSSARRGRICGLAHDNGGKRLADMGRRDFANQNQSANSAKCSWFWKTPRRPAPWA